MRRFRGLGILIFLAVFAAASAVVMLLWNSVVVNVFANVGSLTFWYAAGLLLLSKLLLGGWHHAHSHFHGRHGKSCRKGGVHGKWKECCDPDEFREMHEKFHSMSMKERREYIRRHMAGTSGGDNSFCGGDVDWRGNPDRENEPKQGGKPTDNSSND